MLHRCLGGLADLLSFWSLDNRCFLRQATLCSGLEFKLIRNYHPAFCKGLISTNVRKLHYALSVPYKLGNPCIRSTDICYSKVTVELSKACQILVKFLLPKKNFSPKNINFWSDRLGLTLLFGMWPILWLVSNYASIADWDPTRVSLQKPVYCRSKQWHKRRILKEMIKGLKKGFRSRHLPRDFDRHYLAHP